MSIKKDAEELCLKVDDPWSDDMIEKAIDEKLNAGAEKPKKPTPKKAVPKKPTKAVKVINHTARVYSEPSHAVRLGFEIVRTAKIVLDRLNINHIPTEHLESNLPPVIDSRKRLAHVCARLLDYDHSAPESQHEFTSVFYVLLQSCFVKVFIALTLELQRAVKSHS